MEDQNFPALLAIFAFHEPAYASRRAQIVPCVADVLYRAAIAGKDMIFRLPSSFFVVPESRRTLHARV